MSESDFYHLHPSSPPRGTPPLKPGHAHPNGFSRRPRITVNHGFWWLEDRPRNRAVLLDPLFVPCGWNLSRLANQLGISERTFSRVIEDSIGLRGKTWLRHIRIVRACHLLREFPTIEALARHLGFSQHSDLTREFKKLVGVVPSEFQKQERKRSIIREGSES